MKSRVVLSRPLYEENVGLAARAAANFGCREMAVVRPRCNWRSTTALSRAMHGKGILLRAKEFGNLGQATAGCSYVIATTAKAGKGGKISRAAVPLKRFAGEFASSRKKAAIVFGPEPSGLTNEEIAECDFVVTVPSSCKYRALNLGCAVALVLYELFSAKAGKGFCFREAGHLKRRLLAEKFQAVEEMLPGIENRKAVLASFKALTGRALLGEKEASALLAFLSETEKELRGKGKN